MAIKQFQAFDLDKSRVIINGKVIDIPDGDNHNISIVNDQVFVDGKQYINGKWKRTLRALFHQFF